MDLDFGYDVSETGVATITLDRPEVLNALTFDIYAQLRDRFVALRTEDDVRAVVITGANGAFCSGGDVHQIIGKLLDGDVRDHLAFCRLTGDTVRAVRRLDKPVIAAVEGIAAGAGAVLALASDLRVAARDARFAFLFTKVGLTGGDMGAAYLLPRVVGLGRASELLLLGDTIPAETAERYGLVNRLTDSGQALPAAMEWAERLAAGPALALSMTKRLLENEWHMDLEGAVETEAEAQALLMMAEDHRRFYEAFQAGERPTFVGR